MVKKIYEKLKNTFNNLEEKNLKLMKFGFKFSFVIAMISSIILITYLFFVHTPIVYKLGIIIFEISLYFMADFFVSGIAIDSIKKQMI